MISLRCSCCAAGGDRPVRHRGRELPLNTNAELVIGPLPEPQQHRQQDADDDVLFLFTVARNESKMRPAVFYAVLEIVW